jgi:uncharacterized membrane protein (DUF2068 family)
MPEGLVTSPRRKQKKQSSGSASHSAILRLIAAFKLFKGLVLFAVGIGLVRLMHKDLAVEAERWADLFRVDPNNVHIHRFLERMSIMNGRKLKEYSVGTFFYSALLLTEGTGLMLRKHWAEYFTIIVTGSFIPLEVYELMRRVTTPKIVVLVLNVAIVVYLVVELVRNRDSR